jgi:hypothetical protein
LLLKRWGKFSASTSPGKLALTTPEQIGEIIFAALAPDATHCIVNASLCFTYPGLHAADDVAGAI